MIVTTSCGQVKGSLENNLYVFRGIPYAEPPIHDRRFLPPEPKQPWSGVLEAKEFGPIAFQPSAFNESAVNRVMSEDCLTLNIWKNNNDKHNCPVLVHIHGGGFTGGTGADFANTHYASNHDIICVSINYRLGVFGFLYLGDLLGEKYIPSGNNGILDILEALRWIKENIEHFGGDPQRITLHGASAGAKCISTLLTIPESEGLFQQVILQSGAMQSIRDTKTAAKITSMHLQALNIEPEHVEQLLTLPAEELIAAQDSMLHNFGPVRDGYLISKEQAEPIAITRKIPVLLGANLEESLSMLTFWQELRDQDETSIYKLFGLNSKHVLDVYDQYKQLWADQEAWKHCLTDCLYRIATTRLAEELTKAGHNVWLYRFAYTGSGGAAHGAETAYLTSSAAVENKELAFVMNHAWTNFIVNGSPNSEGIIHWPAFTLQNRELIIFDEISRVEAERKIDGFPLPLQVFKL